MRKPSKAAKAGRALVAANHPGDKEVVVHVLGPLRDNGYQSFDAWWLPGHWWNQEAPAGQAFLSIPADFKRRWEEKGYSLRILPGPFEFNKP